MTRLTTDVDSLNQLFTEGVTDLLGDLVTIFAIISVMLWMDVRLTLISLMTVPLLIAATTWFRKGARRGYDLVRTRIARINAFLQEHFAGAQTVQIFNAEAKSVGTFHTINDQYRRANIETIFYYAVFFPLVDLIGAIGIALIIWYGGYRVMQNTPENTVLTLGALVAFIQYSQRLFQPIRDISDKYNVLQAAVVASHRIFKTLDRADCSSDSGETTQSRTRARSNRISERVVCLQRRRLGAERCVVHGRAGSVDCARWSHGFRQDDDHQLADAFLRHSAWKDSSRWRRSARLGFERHCERTSQSCFRKFFYSAERSKATFVWAARTSRKNVCAGLLRRFTPKVSFDA